MLLTLRDYKHGGNHQQNVTYDAMIAKQDDSRPDIPVAANPLASKPEVFNRVLQHIRERVGLRKSERWTPAQHFYLVWNQDEINAIVTANPAIASGMEPCPKAPWIASWNLPCGDISARTTAGNSNGEMPP